MSLTSRGRRQVANSLFPGNYWVFRNLSLRIRDGGVEASPLPFTVLQRLLPNIVDQLRDRAMRYPDWSRFQNVNVNRIDLVEPVTVRTDVGPTTWWCSSCHNLFNGPLSQVGIQNGRCPSCRQRTMVQLASVFMCPTCHIIAHLLISAPFSPRLSGIVYAHRLQNSGAEYTSIGILDDDLHALLR